MIGKKLKDNMQTVIVFIALLVTIIGFILTSGKYFDMVIENSKRRLSADLIVARKELARLSEVCSVACTAHDQEMRLRWELAEDATERELNKLGVK
ncbi:hypothetical protein KAR91_08530 [Candidatus Pacearchaeota archaeon]|nr:hypothetical protein [Candidatus Pacearchaeota archaeon]